MAGKACARTIDVAAAERTFTTESARMLASYRQAGPHGAGRLDHLPATQSSSAAAPREHLVQAASPNGPAHARFAPGTLAVSPLESVVDVFELRTRSVARRTFRRTRRRCASGRRLRNLEPSRIGRRRGSHGFDRYRRRRRRRRRDQQRKRRGPQEEVSGGRRPFAGREKEPTRGQGNTDDKRDPCHHRQASVGRHGP
jgi:hypothetical protein